MEPLEQLILVEVVVELHIKVLQAALVAAQADLRNPAKDKTANTGTYSYKYADLASISSLALPARAETPNTASSEGPPSPPFEASISAFDLSVGTAFGYSATSPPSVQMLMTRPR